MLNRRSFSRVLLVLGIGIFFLCLMVGLSSVFGATRPVVGGVDYMVTSGHPLSTLAGVKILMQGGNAIDAGTAIHAALNMVEPTMSGLGGDAQIHIYNAKEKKLTTFNACGWAPRKATADFYISQGGMQGRGALSVQMPGAFAGWIMALNRYGTKTLGEVLQPAIEIGERGHPVSVALAGNLSPQNTIDLFKKYPSTTKIWWRDGKPLKAGEIVFQRDLATTFRKLTAAEQANLTKGRSAGLRAAHEFFYKGEIAKGIVDFLKPYGGLFEVDDFADFEAEELPPIMINYKGYEVYQVPPLSQGHVLLEALNVLEGYDLKAMGQNSTDYLHVVAEALKLGFADREAYLADPRFVQTPIKGMLSKEYARAQRARIDMNKAMQWPIPPGKAEQFGNTTFFAVVDKDRNVYACTTSICAPWGSGMVVDGYGFFLNNRMIYFYLNPGHPDELKPRKRALQTINPAIAMKDGKPFMAWGTPGGDQQPQSMTQVFLNFVEFGMTIQDAIESPKIGTMAFPRSDFPHTATNELLVENRIPAKVIDGLKAKGHNVRVVGEWDIGGNNQAIVIDPASGALLAGADPRREGYAIGW